MLREIDLPQQVAGRLYRSAMPGRYEPLDEAANKLHEVGITRVVCLAPEEEIKSKSPEYYDALCSGAFGWPVDRFPVSDYMVPEDLESFSEFVRRIAGYLRNGERVLVHCGAGIGRTGTVAQCLLIELGSRKEQAEERTRDAGAGPETPDQRAFVEEFARKRHKG